jgi:hypothetical protein
VIEEQRMRRTHLVVEALGIAGRHGSSLALVGVGSRRP